MNVLMIGLHPPHIGGISSYVYNVRKALESLGIMVYVVTYGRSSSENVYGTYVSARLRGLSFLITGTRKVYQIIKKENIDVLHAHYLVPPGLVGSMAKKASGLPLVVTCHGSDIFVFSTGWRKVISRHVVHSSDCVACNSLATLNAVHALNASNAVYVPSGVDLNRFRPLQAEREAVTYVGALRNVKGVDIFLRAMEGINEKIWIVGDGPERKSLEVLAKTLKLDCTFWGFRTDIPELMNRSKIVVLPSRNEGFGLTLLEAMACKTPVIGRKTGGIPELIDGENGLLFGTEEELHNEVRILLEDQHLWKKIGGNGLKTASKWNWKKTAQHYAEIYSEF
jgi:glycosyltransferase involved in cell wall biosynthesis